MVEKIIEDFCVIGLFTKMQLKVCVIKKICW